jgi:putative flippase GtrA
VLQPIRVLPLASEMRSVLHLAAKTACLLRCTATGDESAVTIMSLTQYLRFLLVGGTTGVITICCREVIAHFLPSDTPVFYSLSVVCANSIGTAISFVLNRRYTFSSSNVTGWSRFGGFAVIAVVAMFSTWMLSIALRYGLQLDAFFGDLAGGIAFAFATLLSSLITYPLNASVVFRPNARSTRT